jgi:hypothetical protein
MCFEDIVRVAKEMVLRDGYHIPILIVDGSRQPAFLQITDMADTHEARARQMFAAGVRVARDGRMGRLRHVYFVTEAWLSVATDDQPPYLPPSQDPKRAEVLVVSGYARSTRKARMSLFEMIRDQAGELRELRDFKAAQGGEEEVESPLLAAFVRGFIRGSS